MLGTNRRRHVVLGPTHRHGSDRTWVMLLGPAAQAGTILRQRLLASLPFKPGSVLQFFFANPHRPNNNYKLVVGGFLWKKKIVKWIPSRKNGHWRVFLQKTFSLTYKYLLFIQIYFFTKYSNKLQLSYLYNISGHKVQVTKIHQNSSSRLLN